MVNGLSRQIKRGKAEYKFELKRREATCYGESSISEVVDVPFGGIQATMRFPQDPVQNLELQRFFHKMRSLLLNLQEFVQQNLAEEISSILNAFSEENMEDHTILEYLSTVQERVFSGEKR
uniref:Uncharacterized protein n=1 Tax=Oryza punctata TaxID=4537 RepID=A0A0E0LA55_ORYPU